eukprot:3956869-Prymnesium_polylepis.1
MAPAGWSRRRCHRRCAPRGGWRSRTRSRVPTPHALPDRTRVSSAGHGRFSVQVSVPPNRNEEGQGTERGRPRLLARTCPWF